MLSMTNLDNARNVSERLRVDTQQIQHSSLPVKLTASFGVTQYQPGDTLHDLIKHADTALYRAKRDGRNQVVVWPERVSHFIETPAPSANQASY